MHIPTFFCISIVIRASIKNAVIFGVDFYNQVPIFALRTFANIVFMYTVIRHKIAHLCVICTYPQVQSIVFIEFIFQRESTYRTTQTKQINDLHIDVICMRNIEVFYQFHKESGGFVLRRCDLNSILCPCHCNIEESPFFSKWHAGIFICHQFHDGIVFNLAGESKFPLKHID